MRNEWSALVWTLRVAGPLWLCDRAPSHYISLGTLTRNAVGSWVSHSQLALVSRTSSPCCQGASWMKRGLINQRQDAYWSWRPLSRLLFQLSYHILDLFLFSRSYCSHLLRLYSHLSQPVSRWYGGFAVAWHIFLSAAAGVIMKIKQIWCGSLCYSLDLFTSWSTC